MAFREPPALAAALEHAEPSAPTACAGWTAHDIAAHLAAGAKEMADLIEEHLAGRPPRATQGYEERERPFRALDQDELLDRMVEPRAVTSPLPGRYQSAVGPLPWSSPARS
jgi:uncharacterized protein (TIGR03083 family)